MYSKTGAPAVEGGGIDDLVNLFKDLRNDIRREQEERKADSASHKEESARLEALRKKETERLEALRKKDRVDAEKRAEEQMKRLEALRKKETERLEALRKNDIEDLKIEIERLKQHNIEREDHWKQKNESTQRYIECLASDIDATTDFLAVGVRLSLLFFPPLPLMSFGSRMRLDSIVSSAATCWTARRHHLLYPWDYVIKATLHPCSSVRLSIQIPLLRSDSRACWRCSPRRRMTYQVKQRS
jgi:hypothetical protein